VRRPPSTGAAPLTGIDTTTRCRSTGCRGRRTAPSRRTRCATALAAERVRRLRQTAQRAGLTVNSVVQGAWATAAVPLQRRVRRGVRHTRVRPAARVGRPRVDGRHVHQHRATRVAVRHTQSAGDGCATLQAAQSEARRHDFCRWPDPVGERPAGRGPRCSTASWCSRTIRSTARVRPRCTGGERCVRWTPPTCRSP
jgi:hypothetical protein